MVASRPDPRYRPEARTERKEPPMSIAMKPPRSAVAGAAAAPHPLGGAAMNGADMIVQVLADEGVDTIFGYSGGAILPTYDHVFRVTDETKVEQTLRTAFHIARSGRPGPVVVDIPRDVQLAKGTYRGSGLLRMRGYEDRLDALARAVVSAADAEAFFRLLGAADRPLIYSGGGVINGDAASELRAFAKRFGIPVVTTLMGIGAVDTTNELSLQLQFVSTTHN